MTQDFVSSYTQEIAYRYNRLKEDAIYRNILRSDGKIPAPDTMGAHGMFVRVRQGLDDYEEFRWRGAPMFQIRIRFEQMRATIDVIDL